MKFCMGIAAVMGLTALGYYVAERLSDIEIALIIGGGMVIMALTAIAIAITIANSRDRANERRNRRNHRDYAQPPAQPPVIVIAGPAQPHQIQQQQGRARLEQRHTSEYYGAPRRTVDSVGPVSRQITGRRWRQVGEEAD